MTTRIRSLALAFVVNVLLPLGLVGGTFSLIQPLLQDKPAPEPPKASDTEPETVSVIALSPQRARAKIRCTGVATPSKEMTLVPEVNGKITWLSPDLAMGGRVKAGQIIAKLDRKDYLLQVRANQTQVAKAKLDLAIEQERGEVAKRELRLLAENTDLPQGTNRELATRKHHLEAAQVAVDAAQSAVDQAQTKLARTVLRAPFDAVVVREQAEIGQVVGPGAGIATLIGADALHVRATLPVSALRQLVLTGEPDTRSEAIVTLQASPDPELSWTAHADRLMHELDAKTMDAQVLFTVDNPFSTEGGKLPLLSGSLVQLVIEGAQELDVYPIPRASLVQGREVWILNSDDELERVTLNTRWTDRDVVYAQAPQLKPGVRVLRHAPKRSVPGAKVNVAPNADAEEAL